MKKVKKSTSEVKLLTCKHCGITTYCKKVAKGVYSCSFCKKEFKG
jgi:ribosomal protein L37AE/L43A